MVRAPIVLLPLPHSAAMIPRRVASSILTAAAITWAWGSKGWRGAAAEAGGGCPAGAGGGREGLAGRGGEVGERVPAGDVQRLEELRRLLHMVAPERREVGVNRLDL